MNLVSIEHLCPKKLTLSIHVTVKDLCQKSCNKTSVETLYTDACRNIWKRSLHNFSDQCAWRRPLGNELKSLSVFRGGMLVRVDWKFSRIFCKIPCIFWCLAFKSLDSKEGPGAPGPRGLWARTSATCLTRSSTACSANKRNAHGNHQLLQCRHHFSPRYLPVFFAWFLWLSFMMLVFGMQPIRRPWKGC